jgi:hypothetical protein
VSDAVIDNASTQSACESADVAGGDEAEPIPPRFWWLKRLVVAGVVLLAAMVLLRLLWGLEAQRRARAEFERYRAAGQPVYVADFDRMLDKVPRWDNAAVLYERAINNIVPTTTLGVGFGRFVSEIENLCEDRATAEELLNSNGPALNLAHQARSRPTVAWNSRLADTSRLFTTHLSGQRLLAKVLWFAAFYQHQVGDHAAAVDAAADLVAFNDAVAAHPTLMSTLLGQAGRYLTFSLIERIGHTLQIGNGQQGSEAPLRPATRSQVTELIGLLLQEQRFLEATTQAYWGERACSLAESEAMAADIPAGSVIRPLLVLDMIRLARIWTARADAVAQANWPVAATHLPAENDSGALLHLLTHPITNALSRGTGRDTRIIVSRHFVCLAQRRMAATGLAMRLFEIDHGHRPTQLADLVPDYLPAVPADPFSPDGARIRYRPAVEPAVLYSLGADGKDDGGAEASDRWYWPYKPGDIVFGLDGSRPRG